MPEIQDEILQLEKDLLTSVVRASADRLDRVISDQFVEFGSAGCIYTKRDVIAQMMAKPQITVSVADFSVLELSPDVALATYRTERSFRSSIWRRESGQWRIIFHQGTTVVTTDR